MFRGNGALGIEIKISMCLFWEEVDEKIVILFSFTDVQFTHS